MVSRTSTLRRCSPSPTLALLLSGLIGWAAAIAPVPAGAAGSPPEPGVAGTVTDAADGRPVPMARIEVRDGNGVVLGRVLTRQDGSFRLPRLPGPVTLVCSRLGYREVRRTGIAPGSPAALEVRLVLDAAPLLADEVVVTASRRPELESSAPAATSVLGPRELQAQPRLTPVDAARDVPGMDFASKGLLQHTFAVRGYRSAMSSTMLVLVDGRYAALPVLGFNLPYLMTAADEDIERIEIARGPGAALYGPNSAYGVMHIVTRSPFDAPGTVVSFTGGDRSLWQGTLRHAERLGRRAAWKLTAQHLSGHDWETVDPVELKERQDALEDGDAARAAMIAARDFDLERSTGEIRLDWLPGDETSVILAGGAAVTSNIDLANTVGAVQARDWTNAFLQARLRYRRLEGGLLWNGTDSGQTYALRSGQPIVDRSQILAAQLRHELDPWRPLHLQYGLDARRSAPSTGGTLHGANEDHDTMTELGGYVSAGATLRSAWELVGALRVDYHDRLNDLAVSPRLGTVYHPAAEHSLRLTWNRAFSSPTANDLFMDYATGYTLLPGMGVRLRGIPKDGLRFRDETGDLSMRSPLAPGGTAAVLPADATRVWPALVEAVGPSLGPELADALRAMAPPDPEQVGTDLRLLDYRSGQFLPIDAAAVADVAADKRVLSSTVELGYKGRLGDGLGVTVDLYRSRVRDFYGELYAVTPNVFLDGPDLRRYLQAQGLTAEQAEAVAQAAAGVPVGTVVPAGFASADVLLANRQGGSYTLWGVDLGWRLALGRRLSVTGSYSWLSDDTVLDRPEVGRMYLSVPRNKGTLGVQWQDDRRGRQAWLQARAVQTFPVVSGVFAGDVAGYAVLDLGAELRVPSGRDVRLGLVALNALDRRHREFVGAPPLGRLLLTRVRVAI